MSGLEELNNVLEQKNLGYWNFVRHDSASEEPTPFFKSCLWKWKDISSALEKAGEVLDLTQYFWKVHRVSHT